MDKPLDKTEQATLLAIARAAIIAYVRDGIPYEPTCDEASLQQQRGCFVTLSQGGQLRGCLGVFDSQQPLYKQVATMAIAAATEDPRFYPMRQADLGDFAIEISVLSPLRKISDPAEVTVGQHGIYLEKDGQRGVLLPQVAIEHHWDRLTFLQQTCRKAGLPLDAWQAPDCNIYLFSAQILKEA